MRIVLASRLASLFACALLVLAPAAAQDNSFPKGTEGELYYCARVDLVPAEQGGPLDVEVDGVLDEEAWARAEWQSWSVSLEMPRGDPLPPDFLPVTESGDADFEWAAVADSEFLYVAWRVSDDRLQNVENFQCDAWQDDSLEFYIDALNDGPDCAADGNARCYGTDDQQITVGTENFGRTDPNELVFGGVGLGANCDFSGPHPEVAAGVVREVDDADSGAYIGWVAEIAVALETLGNLDDGTPEWLIEPTHGRVIGWNLHLNDDDDAGGRDHKLIWSAFETQESSWRNPGVFAKLMFVDPTLPPPKLVPPVSGLTCRRDALDRVLVQWTNPPQANPDVELHVLIDAEEVGTLPGTSASVVLSVENVPLDGADHRIAVVNESEVPIECVLVEAPFGPCGGIRSWNILGAFDNPEGAAPTLDVMRLDYMTDGDLEEIDFEWRDGAQIETDFGGVAASTSIDGGAAGRNPGGVPTVFSRVGESSSVSFQAADVFGSDLDNVMVYAQTYIVAEEETEAFLGVSSDDSVQVLLNGEEVWANSVPRPASDACAPDDVTPAPVLLLQGSNSLVVKVFEGSGDWGLALRFQDDLGNPVTEGLDVSLEPPVPDNPKVVFHRADATGDGKLNITDAVFVLNFLFLGGPAPGCREAADADDDGKLNITDGVFTLNFLFLGGPSPLDPGPPPGACGPDPAGSPDIGCDAYDGC